MTAERLCGRQSIKDNYQDKKGTVSWDYFSTHILYF
jgi:hypothetical protein